MKVIVGIDLGTTNSVIAIMGHYPGKGFIYGPVTVVWDDVERLMQASAVCMVDGQLTVGDDAKLLAAEGYTPVRFVKKFMGTQEKFRVGDQEWTADEVSKAVLQHMCGLVEKALRVKVDHVVITHPAYFDALAINATKNAATLAGLNVDGMLHTEPVAAAMAYTRDDDNPELRVLVYDLGGGTFDVTLVDRNEQTFRTLACGGNRELGGYNFDKKIASAMLKGLVAKGYKLDIDVDHPERDPRWASLMHHAEQLKIKLSDPKAARVDVRISGVFKDDSQPPKAVQLSYSITANEFLELIEPELKSTINDTFDVLRRGLSGADTGESLESLTLEQRRERQRALAQHVDRIVLVGGSCRIPAIHKRLALEFGREPDQIDENVLDLSVAVGAAMIASLTAATPVENIEDGIALPLIPAETHHARLAFAGRVLPTDEHPDPSGYVVTVTGGLSEMATALSGKDGGFVVEVELYVDQPNELELVITAPDDRERFRRTYQVTHNPAAREGSAPKAPPAVLPKPISAASMMGLVELAPENAPLPFKETHPFKTKIELREIPIEIYQEDMQLCEMRLTGFSSPVPANTKGELTIEIRADYSMELTAAAASMSKTQTVRLTPPRIPGVDELRLEFNQLRSEYCEQLENTPDGAEKARVAAQCDRLIEQIETQLAEAHPERMQVYMLNKRLFLLKKQLPVGGVVLLPPKAVLDQKLIQARDLLPRAITAKPSLADQQIPSTLDILQAEAIKAYQAANAPQWSRINQNVDEIVRMLDAAVKPPPPPPPPPGPMKELLEQTIDETRLLVNSKRKSGELDPEKTEVGLRELTTASNKLDAVDIGAGDAATAKIIDIYRQHVKPVEELINIQSGNKGKPGNGPVEFLRS